MGKTTSKEEERKVKEEIPTSNKILQMKKILFEVIIARDLFEIVHTILKKIRRCGVEMVNINFYSGKFGRDLFDVFLDTLLGSRYYHTVPTEIINIIENDWKKALIQLTATSPHSELDEKEISFLVWSALAGKIEEIRKAKQEHGFNLYEKCDEIHIALNCRKLLQSNPNVEDFPIVAGIFLFCLKRILDATIPLFQVDWNPAFNLLLQEYDKQKAIFVNLFAETNVREFVALPIAWPKELNLLTLSYAGVAPTYELILQRLLTRPEFND